MPKPTRDPKPRTRSALILFRIVLIIIGITLLIVLLFLSIGRIRLHETGREALGSFIYTALIGIPSIFVLSWVSHRFTSKYPRLIFLAQALILACTATTGCLAAGVILRIVGMVPREGYWREFWGSYPFSLVISLTIGLSLSTYETLRFRLQAATLELRTHEVEQERANKLLAEAQLSSLESRIHPHFLFNTLNSIAALIPSDPQRAEDTVAKLASLLRFSLNAPHNRLVPLAQELKIVRDYLEIESTRFGPRLRFQITVPDSLAALKVPPLALQTLVENCVKHVAAHRSEGTAIRITAAEEAGRVQLEVADDGPGFSLDAISPEHGLGNLIARLELLFGNTGQLAVTRENGQTVVRLSFPAES